MTYLAVTSDLVDIRMPQDRAELLVQAIAQTEPDLLREVGANFEGSGLERLLGARDSVLHQISPAAPEADLNPSRVALSPEIAQMVVRAFDAYSSNSARMKPETSDIFNDIRERLQGWVESAPGPDNIPLNFPVSRARAYLLQHCIDAALPYAFSGYSQKHVAEIKSVSERMKAVMAIPVAPRKDLNADVSLRLDGETASLLARALVEGCERLKSQLHDADDIALSDLADLAQELNTRLESLDGPSP